MKFTYCGPYDEVEILLESGSKFVKHGETFTVSKSDAPGLLAQPANYAPVTTNEGAK